MKMNSTNFVSAIKAVIIDLTLLLTCYEKIEIDNNTTREEIEILDGRFGEILGSMQDVVDFAGESRFTADMVSDNLGEGLRLTSAILREKTRIIKTCAALSDSWNVDDYVSLN